MKFVCDMGDIDKVGALEIIPTENFRLYFATPMMNALALVHLENDIMMCDGAQLRLKMAIIFA